MGTIRELPAEEIEALLRTAIVGRIAGSFASARRITRSRPGGTSARRALGRGGIASVCIIISFGNVPENGWSPVQSSYSMQPRA